MHCFIGEGHNISMHFCLKVPAKKATLHCGARLLRMQKIHQKQGLHIHIRKDKSACLLSNVNSLPTSMHKVTLIV